MFCTKFGYIWPSGSKEEVQNVKSLHTGGRTDGQAEGRTDRRTDDKQQAIRKLT